MNSGLIKFFSIVGLGLTWGLSGCGVLNKAIDDLVQPTRSNNQATRQTTPIAEPTTGQPTNEATKVVTSSDGKLQVTVPVDWKEDRDLNEKAELQVSNRADELYTIVLSESKSDFKDMTLARHSELTREILVKNLTSPQVSDPEKLTVNGVPALQYEIQGTIDNLNVTYLHTTVETATSYNQIISWTLRSRYAKNSPKLQAVIRSFREVAQ
ncbi:hypothetical protein BST81_22190 [Leptolyngbya sp. 'hensonii']|uniref:hypothetical protein n=1 Tax=Leptolyngbya sp. 'hensonii' TaxID=1922337 RepID=UPI00094F8D82|nr:hypothetical protein [Leptolyngbya sp. 'hensonii']OLP16308.1 hypothetical protein BST81_22190 [Leptolyngbya sp. 'hensonii']